MKLDGIWIGDLDKKIIIEEPVITIDSVSGQSKITGWEIVATAWSNRQQDSKESFEVEKQVSNDSGHWAIRYNSRIDETMRINDHNVYHYIKGIRYVDRNSYMVLNTERRDG